MNNVIFGSAHRPLISRENLSFKNWNFFPNIKALWQRLPNKVEALFNSFFVEKVVFNNNAIFIKGNFLCYNKCQVVFFDN